MKLFRDVSICCALVAASAVGLAQSTTSGAGATVSTTRYFQLTLELKYPASVDGQQQPADQSITTQVAVGDRKPGSCKTRMTSQFPLVMAGKTTFVDLGTKFDCNNVHVEGDGLTLSIVLETSSVRGTVLTKNHDGSETEEPIISQRSLALSVKQLALGTPEVIFDSKAIDTSKLKKTELSAVPTPTASVQQPGLQVVMTVTELK